MSSLLEKARAAGQGRVFSPPSPEVIELALAWLQDQITTKQAYTATHPNRNTNPSNVLVLIANALRAAHRQGLLSIKATEAVS